MAENWGRGIGALAVLGGLWVLVYWWWEPSRPRISFDESSVPPGTPSAAPVTPVVAPPPRPKAPSATPHAQPPRGAPPPIAVIPPSFRPYTVKGRDTWDSIASREMGSESLSLELRKANPYVTDLKTGRELRIPLDPGNIQGRPTGAGPTGAPAEPLVVEYTIKRGDTLGAIARAYYGSTAYKDLIFEANRDRLERDDALRIGQVLRLPPKPN